MTAEVLYLVIVVLGIAAVAFFSGAETAFVSLPHLRVEHMVATGQKGAARVAALVSRPERLLSTILLGNSLVTVAVASVATALAVKWWGEGGGVVLATLGVTILLLIFGETSPKTIAINHAEKLSVAFAPVVAGIAWLFSPVITALGWVASGIARLFGGAPLKKSLVSEGEIRTMITVGSREGSVGEEKAELLHGVFEFSDRPVREVIVPRPEVVSVEKGSTLAAFLAIYEKSPMSRFPVYADSMDNVIGIMSIKDVLMAQAKGTLALDSNIDELIRPAYFAPESKPIGKLFAEMREKNYRMCVVVDEYGGTAGIVSLSRLMEELVGPVGDELAAAEKDYESINEYTFQVDGGMRIEEANQEMVLELPEGDYETVAGFILHLLGYIPKQGQQIKYRDLKIVVTRMRGLKIDEVLITREKRAAPKS